MTAKNEAQAKTVVERTSERELVVTRSFAAPARLVFEAWSKPELFRRWWAPKSSGASLLSCDIDMRTGGGYRLEFGHPSSDQTMAFFGKYLDVTPPTRIVWTNEESDGGSVTTVTFAEADGVTRLTLHELYPSKEALDEAMASGSTTGWSEQYGQLDELLVTLGAGRS